MAYLGELTTDGTIVAMSFSREAARNKNAACRLTIKSEWVYSGGWLSGSRKPRCTSLYDPIQISYVQGQKHTANSGRELLRDDTTSTTLLLYFTTLLLYFTSSRLHYFIYTSLLLHHLL